MKVLDISLKHKYQVSTLIYLKRGLKIGQQMIHIHSTTLLSRLVVVILESYNILVTASSMYLHYSLFYYARTQHGKGLQDSAKNSTDY